MFKVYILYTVHCPCILCNICIGLKYIYCIVNAFTHTLQISIFLDAFKQEIYRPGTAISDASNLRISELGVYS